MLSTYGIPMDELGMQQREAEETNQAMNINNLELVGNSAGEHAKRADLPDIWAEYSSALEPIRNTYQSIVVTDAGQVEQMKAAKALRLTVKEIRCAVEKKRKELTEWHLKEKQAIDGQARKIKDRCETVELYLESQEMFADRLRAEQQAALHKERADKLAPFTFDTNAYNLADMTEEAFETLLADTQAGHERRMVEAAEAKTKADAAIKAAAEEREKLRAENDRLRAEAAKARAELEAQGKEVMALVKAETPLPAGAGDKSLLKDLAGRIFLLIMPVCAGDDARRIVAEADGMRRRFAKWVTDRTEALK